MKPDYILPELLPCFEKWQLVADCYAGEKAIKERGELYLPNPSPANEPAEVKAKRYKDYQTRAVFYNATRKTAKALAGMAFAKYPRFDLPSALDGIQNDVDGSGTDLAQHARRALTMLLLKGRGGLLADFPISQGGTKAMTKHLKPVIKLYEPEQIINWRTTTGNGQKKLSLVVIKESYIKSDDGFKAEYGDQLLVLRLTDGIATSQIYRNTGSGFTPYTEESPILDHAQKPFDTIPFTFIGADDNDETIDDAPLYDLAMLNLAHYRDSADYQEGNFIAGQPTLFITGVTNEWYRDVLQPNGGVHLGSRVGQILGVGATAQLLQASSNNANFEAMQHKEAQMVAIGAKLLDMGGNKTATQASAEINEQTSTLANICNNLSDAYSLAMNFLGRFVGVDGMATVSFNTNFATNKMMPQERAQLIAEWQAGAITWGEMRAKLVDDEIATIEDADEARGIIESEQGDSLMGVLNDRRDDKANGAY